MARGRSGSRNEHLRIEKKYLKGGRNTVQLEFESPVAVSGSAVTRYKDREDGSEYLYTLLVPADARTLFPCFDQPDLKARFSLELELPGIGRRFRMSRAKTIPEQRQIQGDRADLHLPLRLRRRAVRDAARRRRPVRLFVRRARLEAAKAHVGEVLRLNREATAYFERYFARKFPFAEVRPGAAARISLRRHGARRRNLPERGARAFPAPPSAADLLRRVQLIFHETSHQWFGDLVTMRWFDDLWLKEGFANFMAAKATEALLPEFDAWTAFHALKLGAVRTDATRGTTAIRYPLQNLADAKSAYGAIVYSKGPAVLRQASSTSARRCSSARCAISSSATPTARPAGRTWSALRARLGQEARIAGPRLGAARGMATVRVVNGQAGAEGRARRRRLWPMKLRFGFRPGCFLEKKASRIKTPRTSPSSIPTRATSAMAASCSIAKSLERCCAVLRRRQHAAAGAAARGALGIGARRGTRAGAFPRLCRRQLPKTRDDIALCGLLARIEARSGAT
jgi:hypothetical protein